MKQYKDHVAYILENGIERPNRSGENITTKTAFSRQLRFDLSKGLPFVTGKKLQVRSMLEELTWMMRGETHVSTLGNGIWDKWATQGDISNRRILSEGEVVKQLIESDQFPEVKTLIDGSNYLFTLMLEAGKLDEKTNIPLYTTEELRDMVVKGIDIEEFVDLEKIDETLHNAGINTMERTLIHPKGECGPIYGAMWRNYSDTPWDKTVKGVDQFEQALDLLMNDPNSRRIIVNAWNPKLIPKKGFNIEENVASGRMGLPPCHLMFQFVPLPDKDGIYHLNTNLRMRSSDTALGLPFNIGAYAVLTEMFACLTGMGTGELVVDCVDAHIYSDHVEGLVNYLEQPTYDLPTFNKEMFMDIVEEILEPFTDLEGIPRLIKVFDLITAKQLLACIDNYQHGPDIKFNLHD